MTIHTSHKLVFITIGSLALLSIGLTLATSYQWGESNNPFSQSNPTAIIMKVGEENIYQQDLNYEIERAPATNRKDSAVISSLNDKLVNDSIAIQQATKERLIQVDTSIYNSSNKNYQSRIKVIENIKDIINNRAERIEGTLVTIWFNNSIPPKMGVTSAKQVVKEKITQIREDVNNKTITATQAIERIQKDSSLKEIDAAYQANAGYTFNKVYGDKITIDKEFDQSLWNLSEGEVGEVAALKGTYDNPFAEEQHEVLYAFAVINKKTQNDLQKDYDAWLQEHKNEYAVTKY